MKNCKGCLLPRECECECDTCKTARQMESSHGDIVKMESDVVIFMKNFNTRIFDSRGADMSYSQNDTVILLMNGKFDIIDKQKFKDMLVDASESDDFATELLDYFWTN